MDLDVWREPLLPDTTVTMEGIMVAECHELTHPLEGDLTGGAARTAYLEFAAPDGVTIAAPSAVHFDRTACAGADAAYERVSVEVTATDILRALEVQEATYRLSWSDGSVAWENQMVLQMEYLPGFELRVEEPEAQGRPQEQIPYPVTICNHANGASLFEFQVVTQDTKGFPLAPESLVLDAAGDPRDCATFTVTYVTPFENGKNQVNEEFSIQVAQSFVHDPSRKGPTETFTLGAETEGVYVPSAGALVLPGLLIALLARRR